jgi:hypothetical protein
MPRGDGTGPDGQGRKSGRGQGPCNQGGQPAQPQQGGVGRRGGQGKGRGGGGRGQGQGGGGGRGRGQNR